MIDKSFEDVFTEDWVATHIQNTEHKLVTLGQMMFVGWYYRCRYCLLSVD